MQITSNVTNPNFTAKLKKTPELEALVHFMNAEEKIKYGMALAKLSTTHSGDTLELRLNDEKKYPPRTFSIVNTKDENKKYYVGNIYNMGQDTDGKRFGPAFLNRVLDKIATPGTISHLAVFSHSREEADAEFKKQQEKENRKSLIDKWIDKCASED